jgi:predicted regulator of Ras-like GTPase activity (Roadblock/LC7/MglB family)
MSETSSVARHLAELVREVAGVRGVLVATRDGHPIVHNLPTTGAASGDASLSTAAMIAALLGIGQRLSELTGDPMLLEATVRSPAGQVVIYAVGESAVMTVLTDASVNLARLNHASRLRIPALVPLLESPEQPVTPVSAHVA